MKVIDLLNKIANGEEVPEKIKYDNTIYEYNEQYDYKNELQINYYSVDKGEDFFNEVYCFSLNEEVEIIEEPQEHKIPEKIKMRVDSVGDINNKIENLNLNQMVIEDKINEILDYLEVNNGFMD